MGHPGRVSAGGLVRAALDASRMGDRASCEQIGAFLCLGVVVLLFASALWVVAWCPTCEESAGGAFTGAASPAREGGEHEVTGESGEVLSCRPIIYVRNGYMTYTGAERCGLLEARVEPNLGDGAAALGGA